MAYETRCKTGRSSAKVHAPKSHRNVLQRTHPVHPIGLETDVLVCSYDLGGFGTVWLPYETRAKRVELVQKFVPRSYIGILLNERTQSTPLDPKLTFWCVSYNLGAFRDRLVAL